MFAVSVRGMSHLLVLFLAVHLCHSLTIKELYPFGSQDETLPKQQDVSSSEIALSVPIVHYHDTFGSIYVNDNGLLSFMTEVPSFYNREFPLFYPIIAPMYSDVDTRGHGVVYYRETKEQELCDRATQDVFRHFSDGKHFRALSLFIATWAEVASGEQQAHLQNTVQVAIASNGTESYCFFFYPENSMQWIQAKSDPNMPNAFTQAGFMSNDGRFYKIPGSGTEQVKNYPKMSNINRRGMFAFHCGNTGSGNIILPDKDFEDMLAPKRPETCSNTNYPCLPTANCLEYGTGICCECQRGYYGNGRSCLVSDEPIRVNGKLNGAVNDIKLEDIQLYTYVEAKDGRVYTGVNNIASNLGYDLQTSLVALSSVIGWLFAVPQNGAPNGFTLTGGLFNRTVTVNFPQTGHNAMIAEQYLGLDVFNFLNFKVELRGTFPTIPSDSNVNIEDYKQEFTRVSAGTLKSRLTHSFSFGENSLSMPMIIDQTITFDECPHRPIDYHNLTTRVLVSQNHIVYDTENQIARYASDSKISFLSENSPCSDVKCGPESTCIVEGSSYRCVCNRGFEPVQGGDSNPVCVDIDECRTRGNICDPYAECINQPGSYQCRCLDGFIGNGFSCQSAENACNNIKCDPNADCIQTKNLGPRCMCKNGYFGDGSQCQQMQNDVDDCRSISLCDLNADCKLNRLLGKFACVCKAGYRGDGIVCTEESESCERLQNCGANAECISDETSNHAYYCACNPGYVGDGYTCIAEINADDCSILNNCHRHAECLPDPEKNAFQCRCNSGFAGDGYRCYNSSYINACTAHENCSPNGECAYDQVTQSNVCRCRAGYFGNGVTCNPSNECDPNENTCDPNAQCRFNQAIMKYECQCKLGFHGDGARCVVDESVSCNIVNDCHQNATCVVDPHTLKYDCRCNAGFEGNGKSCRQSLSCNQINNCDVHAECRFDTQLQNYQCQCREGFMGDGYRCRPLRSCGEDRSVCDHNADCQYSPLHKEYICHCHYGFIGDGYKCAPVPAHEGDYLLFSQGMAILRMPLASSSSPSKPGFPLLIKNQQTIVGIDVDCLNGYIYWSDLQTSQIYKAPYNGSSFETVSQSLDVIKAPEGLAIDWVSRNIYWSDSRKKTIEVSNLEGSLHKVLISEKIENPRGVAVHPGSGKLYWSDWDRNGAKIEVSDLDGKMRSVLVSTDLMLPNNIVVDYEHNDLCWTDAGKHRIECINLYTQSRRLIYAQAVYPFDLTIAQSSIYWTDWETKSVHQIDRNGGVAQRLEIPVGGHGKLFGIVTVPKHCPRITNACSVNNGGCKHLCLPNDRGRTCACPDNAYDEDDICNEV